MIRIRVSLLLLVLLTLPPFRHAAAAADHRLLRETPVVRAYRKVAPSVVSISSEKRVPAPVWSGSIVEPQRVNGMGTGVIIDHRGYILTNAHVVERVEKLRVRLLNGTEYAARVVRIDRGHDLALIKINTPQPLQPIEFGTSSDLMVGEPVIAIGNAYGYSHTVSTGIISQLHRTVKLNDTLTYYDLIQTDASINPGNSGGPLLNIYGEVIGINVAIRAEAQNIGFALPIDQVKEVAARLISAEALTGLSHGVAYVDLSSKASPDGPGEGVEVVSVRNEHPEEGLRPGDRVLRVGAIPVRNAIDFERAWIGLKPDESVAIEVQRAGQRMTVHLRPRQSPAQLVWHRLGLRLSQLAAAEVRRFRPELRGGMLVAAVRPDSPAYRAGLRPGDMLVGLHRWETLKYDNVLYILRQPVVQSSEQLRALVIRGGRVREFWIPLTRGLAAR